MQRKTILIVEDEAVAGFAMRETLERRGFHVPEVVAKGDEVLPSVLRHNPDLLLMDIRLNGFLDGIDAVKRLQVLRPVPVIFISSFWDDENRNRLKGLTHNGCLVKPVKEEDLFEAIETALACQN